MASPYFSFPSCRRHPSGEVWRDATKVVFKACRVLRRWKSLCRSPEEYQLEEILVKLETIARLPLRICGTASLGGCSGDTKLGRDGSGRFIGFIAFWRRRNT
ncbi:hypothetical protein C2845_PM05G19530 [Panicum miliaceum]|uniref:Uncharacterized protein n=1 Tax=Panicum miliaceum TaxID=4540 RepID=A0A3L6SXK3_PANMI|nr:hypothetical protein C2845_PM05G19530 [Panicum miliaceum]